MKNVIIFLLLIYTSNMFAQQPLEVFLRCEDKENVPVYEHRQGNKLVAMIKDDAENELWHTMEIIACSRTRFKVRIYDPLKNEGLMAVGWIDKTRCGVHLHGKFMTNDTSIVNLYKNPGEEVPYVTLKSQYPDVFFEFEEKHSVPVLGYKTIAGKIWIKTKLLVENRYVVVWTKDYCPNIYGSCN